MSLTPYQRQLLQKPWASGATRKRSFGQTNISDSNPKSARQGIRPLGQVDISDIPKDIDVRAIMRLPYVCKCGNILLHRPEFCGRCGRGTPIHEWLMEQGRA